MVDAPDMSAPVTRGELQEELKRLEQATSAKIQQAIEPLATKEELRKAIEPLTTKAELELWTGALLARIESRIDSIERAQQQLQQQFQTDLARHANALHESLAALIRGLDDKYKDLPPRVGRLESAVFGPKQP